jgi:DNA-binding transcriptional LysR family regulator
MDLDSTEAIKSVVEAGLGIGFAARRAIHNELKLGTLAELIVKRLSIRPTGAFLRFLRSVRDTRSVEFTP